MDNPGRYLMIGGAVLFLIGGGVYLASRFGLPFGRLPGDFHFGGRNWDVYFPLASTIILSIILTVLLNVVIRLFRK